MSNRAVVISISRKHYAVSNNVQLPVNKSLGYLLLSSVNL